MNQQYKGATQQAMTRITSAGSIKIFKTITTMPTKKIFSYENKLLFLLTFTFGFVLFDRMALNFLVPFFDKELGLNNTQIGLLASLLALGWAISGYAIG